AHIDRLPQPLDLGALRRLKEIELVELLVFPLELGELRLDARAARRRLSVQHLEELSVAPSEPAIFGIAGFVEQLHDLVRVHVLDLLDAEERGLAPLPLDLLRQPLEMLVVVRRIGQQVDGPLESDGADRAEAPPHTDPQARRIRRQADYEEEEPRTHCVSNMKLLFHLSNML